MLKGDLSESLLTYFTYPELISSIVQQISRYFSMTNKRKKPMSVAKSASISLLKGLKHDIDCLIKALEQEHDPACCHACREIKINRLPQPWLYQNSLRDNSVTAYIDHINHMINVVSS